ncbi:MAG: amidase [Mycobacteriales bacterium]|nr:MAG: amidase [Pseudonocardiales bacterium]
MRRHTLRIVSAIAMAAAATSAALVATGSGSANPAPAPPTDTRGPGGLNLDTTTIPQLQTAMNAHRLTSAALTTFYLDRIRRLNPELHAVITTNPAALTEAAASDRSRRNGHLRSPLEGIPVLLKDNVDTRDAEATTAGSLALAQARPASDAFLVTKLRTAGAVILGKANLSEWANFRSTQSSSGWSGVGGQTNNPYVLDRNPCGSSSGSGAGVAADLATVAIGTETDGSIVCPSGANGDVGIKPTLGLISRSGVVPISAEQDTAGPIARSATDAAVTLGVLTGVDPSDPATKASAGHSYSNYAQFLRPGSLRGRRIGIWASCCSGVSNETDSILARTITQLHQLGATTVMVNLPDQATIGANETTALDVEFKHDINAYLSTLGGRHPANLAGLIAFDRAHARQEMPYFRQETFLAAQATSGNLSDPAYKKARATATGLAQKSINQTMAANHLDAIAAPTNSPAWTTDLTNGDHFTLASSSPAAVAGYPDVTVPMGYASGLPVGLSFFASRWQEPKLIGLAYAFEQGTHVRHAPRFLASTP